MAAPSTKHQTRSTVFLILLLAFSAQAGENLLTNPDLSADNGIGNPIGWRPRYVTASDSIEVRNLGTGEFRFAGRGIGRMFLQQEGLTLVSNASYRVTADVRTAGEQGDELMFMVHPERWHWQRNSVGFPVNTSGQWVRVSSVITLRPDMTSGGCVFGIEAKSGKSGCVAADIRSLTFEACDPEVAAKSRPMSADQCRILPARIVPIDPLLARVNAADGRMRFYWPGDPACGITNCTLTATCDGSDKPVSCRLCGDATAEVRFGRLRAKDYRVSLAVCAPDGRTLATNAYTITAGWWKDPAKVGRRLNNLVTELVNEPLKDGDYPFSRAETGWVWISFDGECGEAEGCLDGSPIPVVRRRTGESRLETQRFLTAGDHVLAVRGAKGGRVRIHAVKSIWGCVIKAPPFRCYDKYCDFSTGSKNYTFPFALRFGLLAPFNTFSCGRSWIEHAFASEGGYYLERGNQLCLDCRFNPYSAERQDAEANYRILRDGQWPGGFRMGVNENLVVDDPVSAVNFAEAVWRLADERPNDAIDVFYADTSSGVTYTEPRKSTSEIAAIVNSGRGLGLLIPELYLPVLDNAKSLDEYVDSCAEFMASSERFVPAARGKTVLYTASYISIGDWSNYCSPKADIKVHFANLIRAFATDPRFAGCAGVAFGGMVGCEEEFRRWGTKVIRHYALEGATDDIVEGTGFTWAPGLVRDPDFEEGLKAWTVRPAEEGAVYADNLPKYGVRYQRRICIGRQYKGHLVLPQGFGDTVATFRSSAAGANEVSQRITGLVPGRHYSLLACVADKKTLTTGTPHTWKLPPFTFSARMEGATEVRGLRFFNSQRGEWAPPGAKNHAVMYNLRYVFRADAPEATLVFSDRGDDGKALAPGTELSLNYVVLRPYYTESDDEIPEIVRLLGWERDESRR